MEYSPLVIGDKKTKYPLVQGGMGVGISLGGLATELPAYVKGFATKIAPIVSGEKAAQVLLKLWDKRYQTTSQKPPCSS